MAKLKNIVDRVIESDVLVVGGGGGGGAGANAEVAAAVRYLSK
jgi:succinate dehydrogenase/fumarate reductase flavoprotein subunit